MLLPDPFQRFLTIRVHSVILIVDDKVEFIDRLPLLYQAFKIRFQLVNNVCVRFLYFFGSEYLEKYAITFDVPVVFPVSNYPPRFDLLKIRFGIIHDLCEYVFASTPVCYMDFQFEKSSGIVHCYFL